MLIQITPYPAAPEGGSSGEIAYVGGKSDTWDGTGATRNISLTNLTGGLAASPSENDIVVLSLSVISSSSGDMNLATTGYTEHCDIYKDDTVTLNFGVFSKFMGASPDSSVTIQTIPLATGNNNWAHVRLTVWRGVNLTTPMDVAVVTNSGTDTASATSPAITPVTAGAMVIDAAASCCGNALSVLNMSNPGSFSPFLMSKYAKGVSSMGGKEWPGSGAMGPYAHGGGTDTTACWAALQMALRPA
jgi:hypothetical protein